MDKLSPPALTPPQRSTCARQDDPTSARTNQSVRVALGERSYDIVVGHGLLRDATSWPALPAAHTAVIVSNPTVHALHGAALHQTLQARHAQVLTVLLPDGESFKNWQAVDTIITTMLEAACDRKTTLYALGGGVIGDTTGFAAACYMRGAAFVQVPTTLLAQVDSSVGGKTAINHALGKNMVGAFYQPLAVLCDLSTLATLPDREFRSGLAEIIKLGPIADADFLVWIEANLDALLARDDAALQYAVRKSCEIKAHIVAADEREVGLRAVLNFGHTFAHAIEGALGYGQWLHGEAVACGMVLASDLSVALRLMPPAFAERMVRLIERTGLPVQAPDLSFDVWSRWLRVDKKVEAGAVQFVVVDALGHAVVRPADDAMVQDVIRRHATLGMGSQAMSTAAPLLRP
jgi:3-dehydroquinate synthase